MSLKYSKAAIEEYCIAKGQPVKVTYLLKKKKMIHSYVILKPYFLLTERHKQS